MINMTKEDKELLLKDLCGRLPYDVFVNINDIKCILQPHDISDLIKCDTDIKPYLFPLSSMTEEQKEEFNSYFASVPYYGDNIHIPYYSVELLIDFYNKHYLDWRGLIPKGLAIDATGLNIY